MKVYIENHDKSVGWTEEIDDNNKSSGFIKKGQIRVEELDGAPLVDDKGELTGGFEKIFKDIDLWQEMLDQEADGSISIAWLSAADKEKKDQEIENVLAKQYLAYTDWYIIRKTETGEPIPEGVTTSRADARISIV